jgi:hypothetical protein
MNDTEICIFRERPYELSTAPDTAAEHQSISVGGAYTMDNIEISGGVRYVKIGDATSSGLGGANGTFSGNSVIGIGFKVGVTF